MSRDVNDPGTEMSLGRSIIGLKFTACETSLQKCPVVEIISDQNVRGPMYPETNCSGRNFSGPKVPCAKIPGRKYFLAETSRDLEMSLNRYVSGPKYSGAEMILDRNVPGRIFLG